VRNIRFGFGTSDDYRLEQAAHGCAAAAASLHGRDGRRFWRRVLRPVVFAIFCFAAFYAVQSIGYSVAFRFTGKAD